MDQRVANASPLRRPHDPLRPSFAPDAPAADASTKPDAAAGLAPMAMARSLFAAVTGKDARIRTFGGLTGFGLDNTTESYDPAKNTWTKTAATASVHRYGHAATQDANGSSSSAGPRMAGRRSPTPRSSRPPMARGRTSRLSRRPASASPPRPGRTGGSTRSADVARAARPAVSSRSTRRTRSRGRRARASPLRAWRWSP